MSNGLAAIGTWWNTTGRACFAADELPGAIAEFRTPAFVVHEGVGGRVGLAVGGELHLPADNGMPGSAGSYPCLGVLPALYPEWLGDRGFLEAHGVRFPYATGAMARGIASEALVIAIARAGMLGFFGAGGLSLPRVEQALATLQEALGDALPWGVNLIHSPQDPELETRLAALLLARGVRRVEASAFMALTPAVVRYAYSGIWRDSSGHIQRTNHVFAKISRPKWRSISSRPRRRQCSTPSCTRAN